MFRSTPTSGRVHRVLTLAALLCSALVALPAAAQVPTEAPVLEVVVPAKVMGTDLLRVTLPADVEAAEVQITDSAEAVSRWIVDVEDVDAATESGEFSFDLNAPDEGDVPLNGPASVVILIDDVEALAASVLLDRAPGAPVLSADRSRGRVALNWPHVAGPGAVVYRVDRAAAGQAWVVLRRELSHSAYLDTSVTPGRYRYRVTAAVASADGGENRSAPAFVGVHVTGPAPPPPDPTPTETAPPVAPDPQPRPVPVQEAPDPQPTPPRNVAVTGDIRHPVEPRPRPAPRQRTGRPDFSELRTMYRFRQQAPAPALAEREIPAKPAQPAPQVAVPRIRPLPVPVGPVGMLAVEAARGMDGVRVGDAATLICAVLLALVVVRRRRQAGGGRSPVNT